MNCSDARPFLEQLTRSPAGPSINEVAVREHLATCSSCQRTLKSLTQWDEQLSQAMNEVSIPPGLTRRVVTAVSALTCADLVSAPAMGPPRPRIPWSRTLMSVTVAGLLAVVFWQAWLTVKPPMLSPTDVANILQRPIDGLSTAEKSGDLLPRHWSTLKGRIVTHDGKKLDLRELRLSLVVFPLEVRKKGVSPEAGSLFVVPKSRWNSTTSVAISKVPVSDAAVQYTSDYVWIAWTETNYVYILALRGELPLLEQLRSRLGGNHAFL